MPTDIALSLFQGREAIALHAPDGARATVLLHGGHLVSWLPAGGAEQLYLSPKSGFAAGLKACVFGGEIVPGAGMSRLLARLAQNVAAK